MSKTREVRVGKVIVGGGAPVSVQSMAKADPHEADALKKQVLAVAERGCEIFRLTVPDEAAAKVFGEVRAVSPIPLVADIHFDYRLALAALEAGADAVRINPGNIGSAEKVREVVRAAQAKGAAIRIGVNAGSLEKAEAENAANASTVDRLCASALKHIRLLEAENFHNIVVSAKISNAAETIAVYRRLAELTEYPLHLGVTEAGTLLPGTVRNSVALGVLLAEGIGDTIRVSLTAKPEKEVKVALEILRSLGRRAAGPTVTSCPTCGRTMVDLQRVATQIEDALETLNLPKYPHLAVMGCVVNGPGEAKGAELALCGGKSGEFLLYKGGEFVEKIPETDAVKKVVEYVVSL